MSDATNDPIHITEELAERWVRANRLIPASGRSTTNPIASTCDLIAYAGPIAGEITGTERFPSMARTFRDALAHGLKLAEEDDPDWFDDMDWVSRKLQALMRVCLLRDLGLSPDQAAEAARRHPQVHLAIAYTPNRWTS